MNDIKASLVKSEDPDHLALLFFEINAENNHLPVEVVICNTAGLDLPVTPYNLKNDYLVSGDLLTPCKIDPKIRFIKAPPGTFRVTEIRLTGE